MLEGFLSSSLGNATAVSRVSREVPRVFRGLGETVGGDGVADRQNVGVEKRVIEISSEGSRRKRRSGWSTIAPINGNEVRQRK